MKKMTIYEPAMCCETGICGVGVDPELIRISTLLNALKKVGVEIKRFNLNNAPNEFVTNKTINELINTKGVEELPAIMLDDEIIITGRYPSNDEIVKLLGISKDFIKENKVTKSQNCKCNENNCC